MKHFTAFKRLLPGIALLIVAAGVLLISDLENRNQTEKSSGIGLLPEPGRTYRIGIGYFAPEEGNDNVVRGIFDGLAELGFHKGENLEAILKHAGGEIGNIPMMFQSLDNENLDVITPLSTPCLMGALTAVKNNPIVFTYCYDPVAAGAGESYENHLPNVTGVGSFPAITETAEFIKLIVPDAKKVGTIYNSSEANSQKAIAVGQEEFKKTGMEIVAIPITTTNEVVQAMQILAGRGIDAIWITGDNTALQAFDAISATARKHKLPLVLNDKEYVEQGALAAIGQGWYSTGRRAAKVIARVLLGESPADIPMINFVETQVIVNRDMAEEIGIEFPRKVEEMIAASVEPTKKINIAICEYVESPNSEACVRGIREKLAELGYEEGKNLELKIRNAQGDMATLTNIVQAVQSDKPDIIISLSTPTLQAMVKNVSDRPVVFTNVSDPVAAGAGESFTKHKPNFAGISTLSDFEGMVRFVKKFFPDAKKIGTLYTPTEINSEICREKFKNVAESAGYEFESLAVYTSSDISNAADVLCSKGIDVFCQISDNLNNTALASITAAAQKARVPLFSFVSMPVRNNLAMAAVSRDYIQCGKDAAELAIKIYNGAYPGDIPFTYASKTNIFINAELARKLGIEMTPARKKLADEIIGG